MRLLDVRGKQYFVPFKLQRGTAGPPASESGRPHSDRLGDLLKSTRGATDTLVVLSGEFDAEISNGVRHRVVDVAVE